MWHRVFSVIPKTATAAVSAHFNTHISLEPNRPVPPCERHAPLAIHPCCPHSIR
ncbi:hypothetical protein EXIGLDRAFT_724116 [Exidia glandulosa HHB12029]|uniref:Uncharacterized protein n=1 Tax=Exidia glandulosa HHB12029 TaxID=1314781 RepID=A0A165EJT7_EXIGL|nr:hypothetical protein EXIGLDRAFT_724116 [Exidia glandulosa HHB12029]